MKYFDSPAHLVCFVIFTVCGLAGMLVCEGVLPPFYIGEDIDYYAYCCGYFLIVTGMSALLIYYAVTKKDEEAEASDSSQSPKE